MKKICALLAFIVVLLSSVSVHGVLIQQVLYDPFDSAEVVELFNDRNYSVNISEWSLSTSSSDRDAVIPVNTVLAPRERFLIVDPSWNHSSVVPDLTEAITLANANGGVALLNSTGAVVDSVGWGTSSFVVASPAESVEKGLALVRVNVTGNNSRDFLSLPFVPGGGVVVSVLNREVNTSFAVFITDDLNRSGVQVRPARGVTRILEVQVNVSSNVTVEFLGLVVKAEKRNGSVFAFVPLPFTTVPGSYDLLVHDGAVTVTVPVEVLSRKGLRAETSSLLVASGLSSLSVRNVGNVPTAMVLERSRFVFDGAASNVSLLEWSLDGLHFFELTSVPQEINHVLASNESVDIVFRRSKNTVAPGSYKSVVSVREQ